jgi:hypothetical protein
MQSNLVVLLATLAVAGPAYAVGATAAAPAGGGTSSSTSSASSGGFVSSGSSSGSGSSGGSARSSGSGGGGFSGHSGTGGGFTGHSGAGGSAGARGFVSSGGFSRGAFSVAHGSTSLGGQELPAMRSLAHGAAIAVHNQADAQMHRPHRPRPEYNFDCGTRGASAQCYANYNNEYNTPDAQRGWYCSALTPAIERALYCDRIEKTKAGER